MFLVFSVGRIDGLNCYTFIKLVWGMGYEVWGMRYGVWGMGFGALKRSDYVTLRERRSAKWHMKNGT